MSKKLLLATLLCTVTATAWAHGPTRQKVTETMTVAASPAVVWQHIGDFSALHGWHPVVESSATTRGNEPGSIRTLQLKGGGTIVEELTRYSAEDRRLSYKMKDPGPLPVTNYSSTLSVSEAGAGSTIEWRGAFYRGDPNGDPAPDRNDEAAIAAITGVYKAGLENLKKLVEAQ